MPVDLHCVYNSSVSTLYIMHVQFHCVYDLMDLCDYIYLAIMHYMCSTMLCSEAVRHT